MKTLVFELQFGKAKMKALFHNEAPQIEFKRKTYRTVIELIKECKELRAPDALLDLAKVATFLTSGQEHAVIDEPMEYQREYRRRIWQERSSMSPIHPRLSDFGLFDVSQIHIPQLAQGNLTFYVKDQVTDVPQKAQLHLSKGSGLATYTPLPLVE